MFVEFGDPCWLRTCRCEKKIGCAHAELMSCEPTQIEDPQVQRKAWSSAPQYDMYALSGEASRM